MSQVFYSDKEFEQILHKLSDLTEQVEQIDNPLVKDLVNNTLQHFDALHREALHRMWQFMRKNHPELRVKLLSDYSIIHLLALYDLESFDGIETAKDSVVFINEDEVKKLS